jgi:bacteriorhodopsin
MTDSKSEPNLKYGTLLNNSFTTTYIVLFGYTAITLIEALRTPSVNTRHIMNIETTVSLVAGIVYGTFIEKMKQPNFKLEEIVPTRYIDWMITTPLILLAVALFYNTRVGSVDYKCFSIVIILNWLMLLFGYLGERKIISPMKGLLIGFVFFALMLLYIFYNIIPKGCSLVVFIIFAVIWSGYGIAYMLEEEEKNIAYNVLDVTSKALFGVVLWLYFGKVLAF